MATTVQTISPLTPGVVAPAANDAPAATATTIAAQPSFTNLRALRSVTGTESVSLSGLQAPALRPLRIAQADDSDMPVPSDDGDAPPVPPSDDVPAPAPMTLKEREDYISSLASAILQGRAEGVDTTDLETQLNEALWDTTTTSEEKHVLAQWLSSTLITTPDGDDQFMDQALDAALDGANWRSFSFFMYQYTAGFGDVELPPVIVDGGYDAPPWWYESRPYDTYTPYWEYRLPDTSPFPSLPVVVIDIPGRRHWESPVRDHEWHFPRDRGDRFPRPPHGHEPNPHPPVPRPPHFPDHGPRGPRDPHGPHIPGEPPRGPDDHHPPRSPQQPPRGPDDHHPPRSPQQPPPHRTEPPHQPPPAPTPPPHRTEPPRQPPPAPTPPPHRTEPPRQPPPAPTPPPHRTEPPRQPPPAPTPPPHRTEPPRQPPAPRTPPPAPPRREPPPAPRPVPVPRAPAPAPRMPPPPPHMPPPPPPRAPMPSPGGGHRR